jgi:hypothetical protein
MLVMDLLVNMILGVIAVAFLGWGAWPGNGLGGRMRKFVQRFTCHQGSMLLTRRSHVMTESFRRMISPVHLRTYGRRSK